MLLDLSSYERGIGWDSVGRGRKVSVIFELQVSVSIRSELGKTINRHLNRRLLVAGQAGGLENSGAGEGNRTLVISLGNA